MSKILLVNELEDTHGVVEDFDVVVVNTNGGSIDAAMALITAIEAVKAPVYLNSNCSSAGLLFAACSNVVVGPQAWSLIHAPTLVRNSGDFRGIADCYLKACCQWWDLALPILSDIMKCSELDLRDGYYADASVVKAVAGSPEWHDSVFGGMLLL